MEIVEFRVAPDGLVYYKQQGGQEKRLTQFSDDIIKPLAKIVESKFPECFARLATIYGRRGRSEEAKKGVRQQMMERFIRCNFGEHDLLTPDIEHDILHFEEVKCPLRGGFCKEENIICKPRGLIHLPPAEKEVVNLYIEGLTFTDIAKRLGKSPATVKSQLFNVKTRLGLENCREIIRVCRANNY